MDSSSRNAAGARWPGSKPSGLGVALVVGLAVILGAGVGLASDLASTQMVGFVSVAFTFIVSVIATVRYPWIPACAYWAAYSVWSSAQLDAFGLSVGQFPIRISDVLVGLMLFGCLVAWLRSQTNHVHAMPPQSLIGLGMVGILCYSVVSFGIGLANGFPIYSVLIDLRTVSYLVIGYFAAFSFGAGIRQVRLIRNLLWLSLVGFLVQQYAVTSSGVAVIDSSGGRLQDYRDIGVPFFLGKYGLFVSFVTVINKRGGISVVAAAGFVLGVIAMMATFIRTAWIATIAGILTLALINARRLHRMALLLVTCVTVASILISALPQAAQVIDAAQSRLAETFAPRSALADTVGSRIEESERALANLRSPVDWVIGRGFGLSVADPDHPYQHNSFAWLLSKQGVVGLVLFVVVVLLLPTVIGLRRLFDRSTPLSLSSVRSMILVLVAATIANAVSGYASGHLTFWPYSPLIGLTIGWLEVSVSHHLLLATPEGDDV